MPAPLPLCSFPTKMLAHSLGDARDWGLHKRLQTQHRLIVTLGGVKLEYLWNKKSPNQLCWLKLENLWGEKKKKKAQVSWLTTHEGWKQQNKAQASRFCSTASHRGGGIFSQWESKNGQYTLKDHQAIPPPPLTQRTIFEKLGTECNWVGKTLS